MTTHNYNIDQPVWMVFKEAPLMVTVNAIRITRATVSYELAGITGYIPQASLYASLDHLLTSLKEIGERQIKKRAMPPLSFVRPPVDPDSEEAEYAPTTP